MRMLDMVGHRERGQVLRVWIAKDAASEQGQMLAQLRLGVDATAGIIQVGVPQLVQPRILGGAPGVQRGSGGLGWVRAENGGVRRGHVGSFGGVGGVEVRGVRR